MKILIGNPDSVEDGYGDKSFGYTEEDEKDFLKRIHYADLMEDVNKIVTAYRNKNMVVESKYAYYAWVEYSQSLQAHWLVIPDSDDSIINNTLKFLVEKEKL